MKGLLIEEILKLPQWLENQRNGTISECQYNEIENINTPMLHVCTIFQFTELWTKKNFTNYFLSQIPESTRGIGGI